MNIWKISFTLVLSCCVTVFGYAQPVSRHIVTPEYKALPQQTY